MGTSVPTATAGYGFRYGKWKLVVGSTSCTQLDCSVPMLFDLEVDLGETVNLKDTYPDVLEAIMANFSVWNASVQHSRTTESFCEDGPQERALSI